MSEELEAKIVKLEERIAKLKERLNEKKLFTMQMTVVAQRDIYRAALEKILLESGFDGVIICKKAIKDAVSPDILKEVFESEYDYVYKMVPKKEPK